MAYRGHKRCDIDGQSDIASLILPPLSLTHTPAHPCTHVCVPLTPPSPSFFLVFSVLLWLILFVSALSHRSFLPLLSLTGSSLVVSLWGLVQSHFFVFWLLCASIALSCAASPFNSAAALSVLVCTHQHAHKRADSYNHFTRSNNHYFVWRTQGKDASQRTQNRKRFTQIHTYKK